MKSLKYSMLLSLMLLSLMIGHSSWAGVVHGGGGTAVVCRDDKGVIKSAELLDLYEARAKGLKLIPDVNLAANFRTFMNRWIEYHGGVAAPESDEETYDNLIAIMSKAFLTGPGQKLPLLKDFTTGPIPKGCEFEQMAIFNDDAGLLFVDKEIWNAAGRMSGAALLAHEIVYRNDRMVYGYSNSDKARELVGSFFSTTPLKPGSR